MDLAILLKYYDTKPDPDEITYYALKADSITISIAKTPIQVPVPQNTPYLVDFGIFRPAITLSAIVDEKGANETTTAAGYEGMEVVQIGSQAWYIPYRNKLEQALYKWISDDDNILELYVGDTTNPVYNVDSQGNTDSGTNWATGGGIYEVALQQARFQMDAGREDRWICQMQFVTRARKDVVKQEFGG